MLQVEEFNSDGYVRDQINEWLKENKDKKNSRHKVFSRYGWFKCINNLWGGISMETNYQVVFEANSEIVYKPIGEPVEGEENE